MKIYGVLKITNEGSYFESVESENAELAIEFAKEIGFEGKNINLPEEMKKSFMSIGTELVYAVKEIK